MSLVIGSCKQDHTRRRRAAHCLLRAIDVVNVWLVRLCGYALMVMVFSVSLGILARFVFTQLNIHAPTSWTEEVSRYLMIWTVFVGGAVAARSGKMIGVEALVTALPALAGRSLKYIAHSLSLSFYFMLCWIGWQWIEFGGSQNSPVMEMPLTFVNAAMLVGGVFMILNTFALVVEAWMEGKDIRHAAIDDELESATAQFKNTPELGAER